MKTVKFVAEVYFGMGSPCYEVGVFDTREEARDAAIAERDEINEPEWDWDVEEVETDE